MVIGPKHCSCSEQNENTARKKNREKRNQTNGETKSVLSAGKRLKRAKERTTDTTNLPELLHLPAVVKEGKTARRKLRLIF